MQRDRRDNNYIPKDYTDLYTHYIMGPDSLCISIVRKKLRYADADELQQLVQDVFVRCMEKQVITLFDPTKGNFGGVIYFVTRSVVTNHLDKKGRNPLTGLKGGTLVTESSGDENGAFIPGVYSLDRIFPAETPDTETVMVAKDLVQDLMDWTQHLHTEPRHKRDESLYPLMGLLLEERTPKECAERLGVTPSTIHNWIAVLRDAVRDIQSSQEL